MWRLHPSVLRGALWAVIALIEVRIAVRRDGVSARIHRSPHLSRRAAPGVLGVLNRTSPTCLERALVLQAWRRSQGDCRDVVIGVPRDGLGNRPAHAWVDGTDPRSATEYIELHRLRAS